METERSQDKNEVALANGNGAITFDGVLHVSEIWHGALFTSTLCDPDHTFYLQNDNCLSKKVNKAFGHEKRDEEMFANEIEKKGEDAVTVTDGKSQVLCILHRVLLRYDRHVVW